MANSQALGVGRISGERKEEEENLVIQETPGDMKKKNCKIEEK